MEKTILLLGTTAAVLSALDLLPLNVVIAMLLMSQVSVHLGILKMQARDSKRCSMEETGVFKEASRPDPIRPEPMPTPVKVEPREKACADGCVVEEAGVSIFTGEPGPLRKNVGDAVIGGCRLVRKVADEVAQLFVLCVMAVMFICGPGLIPLSKISTGAATPPALEKLFCMVKRGLSAVNDFVMDFPLKKATDLDREWMMADHERELKAKDNRIAFLETQAAELADDIVHLQKKADHLTCALLKHVPADYHWPPAGLGLPPSRVADGPKGSYSTSWVTGGLDVYDPDFVCSRRHRE